MTKWLLVGLIVACTAAADLIQAHGMRRGGARWKVPVSILFLALSFFAFTQLLRIAELSFAVPVTAASLVLETALARPVLKERVGWKRWGGAALAAIGVALLAL
ncbi:MAG: EamA family transporter [Bryobacteraceae bacterium]